MRDLINDVTIYWVAKFGGYKMDKRSLDWKNVLPEIRLNLSENNYYDIPNQFRKLSFKDINNFRENYFKFLN